MSGTQNPDNIVGRRYFNARVNFGADRAVVSLELTEYVSNEETRHVTIADVSFRTCPEMVIDYDADAKEWAVKFIRAVSEGDFAALACKHLPDIDLRVWKLWDEDTSHVL